MRRLPPGSGIIIGLVVSTLLWVGIVVIAVLSLGGRL